MWKQTHKRTYGWDSKALATGRVQLKIPRGHLSREKPFSVRSIMPFFLEEAV